MRSSLNLTTYRKSGEPVRTPVWFAQEALRAHPGERREHRGRDLVEGALATFNMANVSELTPLTVFKEQIIPVVADP